MLFLVRPIQELRAPLQVIMLNCLFSCCTSFQLHVIPRARMEGSVCHQVTVPAPQAGEEEDVKKVSMVAMVGL